MNLHDKFKELMLEEIFTKYNFINHFEIKKNNENNVWDINLYIDEGKYLIDKILNNTDIDKTICYAIKNIKYKVNIINL